MATRVTGRGLRSPLICYTPSPAGLSIRVDGDQDPAIWVEIILDRETLRRLCYRVECLATAETEAELAVLDSPHYPV